MLQNNEAFAFHPGFLVVIAFVKRRSKDPFSRRSADFSLLSGLSQLNLLKKLIALILGRNNFL